VTTPYYPGWQAAVDGRPARIYRADFVFQGLVLDAGAHHVVLRFDPGLFKVGGVISAVAWLGAIAWVAYGLARQW